MGLVIYNSLFGEYVPGIGEGYWRIASRPPIVTTAELPNSTLTLAADRLENRMGLLRQLDQMRHEVDQKRVRHSMDKFNHTAVEIRTADKARAAVDLSQEDPPSPVTLALTSVSWLQPQQPLGRRHACQKPLWHPGYRTHRDPHDATG